MLLNRRRFLSASLLGAAAPAFAARPGRPKNWVWIPTNTKFTPDQWKRRFELMRRSGVRAILPEIYAGREAFYASTHLPVKTDWLSQLLPVARSAGLEVHAWMWSMPCLDPDILAKHPDWYTVNALGESAAVKPAYVPIYKFLDPGRPEVREFVQTTVKELAAIPGLSGIHLDYIRHPDAILPKGLWKKNKVVQDKVYPQWDYGYTEYERSEFRRRFGEDPLHLKDPQLEPSWRQFQLDMVSGLVNDYLVPAAHAGRKQITAAVFPGPSMARVAVRQDWSRWKLDAFLPMLYHNFYEAGPEWVGAQTREAVAAVQAPVYSGLFVGPMKEKEFTTTVETALHAGASGVSIFADRSMNRDKWRALRRLK